MHITKVGLTQSRIDTVCKEKAVYTAAVDSTPGSNCYKKNGFITVINSVIMDIVAFKMKAKISASLHHVYQPYTTWGAPPRD